MMTFMTQGAKAKREWRVLEGVCERQEGLGEELEEVGGRWRGQRSQKVVVIGCADRLRESIHSNSTSSSIARQHALPMQSADIIFRA